LQDLGGGRISAIGYDSPDPIDKTLKSFSLDLTGNPTFGEILNQARGQKIEATVQPTASTQPAILTGVIVGMEEHAGPVEKDVHQLNLLCAEGMRSVPLAQIQRIRFLDPVVEADFRRALDVLAAAHDMQKKVVSLKFNGEGKRTVRVGYVVENPIWKTSYRLVLGKDGKVHLQSWAAVENTTDEDWKDVRMALVSGRPISFQTDLYSPLFVPRPTVEMERFASLRPTEYSGPISNMNLGGVGGANVGGGGNSLNLGLGGGGFQFGLAGGGFNIGGQGGNMQLGNRYRTGGQWGQSGGQANEDGPNNSRLTYKELQQRRQALKEAKDEAKKVGSVMSGLDPTEGVASVASAEEIGDAYRYVIDEKVTLNRQKSALLPILNHDIEGERVSIFNESVHAKFPLLGLRFKNTSGQPLTQGPITVFEEGSYAGDSRIADLQPNEERLLSYAVDLGTEVKAETGPHPTQITAVKVAKGVLSATSKLRATKIYHVKNRSIHERVLLVEHPYQNQTDWKLVSPEKPKEQTRDVYRFQLTIPPGQTAKLEVVEELTRVDLREVSAAGEDTLRMQIKNPIASSAVKAALQKAIGLRARMSETQVEIVEEESRLKALMEDQARLRANIRELPQTSAAYKRYLDKFDAQEPEVEKLQAHIKELSGEIKVRQKELADFLADLNVE
jgi:hypothetical protein